MQLLTTHTPQTPPGTGGKLLLGDAGDASLLSGLSGGGEAERFANVLSGTVDGVIAGSKSVAKPPVSGGLSEADSNLALASSAQLPPSPVASPARLTKPDEALGFEFSDKPPVSGLTTNTPASPLPATLAAKSGKTLPVAGHALPQSAGLSESEAPDRAPSPPLADNAAPVPATQSVIVMPEAAALQNLAQPDIRVSGPQILTDAQPQSSGQRSSGGGVLLPQTPAAQIPPSVVVTAQGLVMQTPVAQAPGVLTLGSTPANVQPAAAPATQGNPDTAQAPRSLVTRPADLAAQTASAPLNNVWQTVAQLGLRETSGSAIVTPKGSINADAEVPAEPGTIAPSSRGETRREADLPQGSAARAATLASSAQPALIGEPLPRSGEAALAPLIDTAQSGRGLGAGAPGVSAQASSTEGVDIADLVNRLVESRVQARADRPHMEFQHADFGRVTLALGLQAEGRISIDLPGSQAELRQAMGQAMGQALGQPMSQPGSPLAAQATNQSVRNESAASTSTGSQADQQSSSDRQAGDARQNQGQNQGPDRQHQDRQHNQRTPAYRDAPSIPPSHANPADENRRGILA